MKFSTRTTYGLRAMISLAKNTKKKNISLSTIAEKEHISLKYLERIFAKLIESKLVTSEKGASGGYKLGKEPKEISVFEVVSVLEGKMSPFHCLNEDGKIYCNKACDCTAAIVLVKVQKAIGDTLKRIKLSELV
jgi:Rrf2 family transcriptional regulator, cysteine metabolism repressor